MEPLNRRQAMPRWPYIVSALVILAGVMPLIVGHDHSKQSSILARGETFEWNPLLTIFHASTDALIGLSYVAISLTLTHVAFSLRNHLAFNWIFFAFGAFIITCGLTHFVKVLTIWHPSYWLAAMVNYATAVASVGTALVLPTIIPKIRNLLADTLDKDKTRDELALQVEAREREIKASEAHARGLVGKIEAAQQRERARLSREIHDGVTQTALATHWGLQAYRRRHLDVGKEMMDKGHIDGPTLDTFTTSLDDIVELAQKTVKDSRAVIDDLRTTVLDDFGLHAAIQQKVEQLQEEGWCIEYDMRTDDPSSPDRLQWESETALYRVVQEALTNINKHAQATLVRIELIFLCENDDEPNATLVITDNGRGFDQSRQQSNLVRRGRGEHVGLESMAERVKLLGGELTIRSIPGEGTSIKACIPIPTELEGEDASA